MIDVPHALSGVCYRAPVRRRSEAMSGFQPLFLDLGGWLHRHLTNTMPMTGIEKTFLALVAVLIAARLCGGIAVRLGQSRVVGEIIAGILLGPTVFGAAHDTALFPQASRDILNILGQLGLMFLMFVAGLDLDLRLLKGRIPRVLVLAVSSVAIPVLLAWPVSYLVTDPAFKLPGVGNLAFILILGAGFAVSAFPVAVLVLYERNLFDTELGRLTVSAAAVITLLMFLVVAQAADVARHAGVAPFFRRAGIFVVLAVVLLVGLQRLASRLEARRPEIFERASPDVFVLLVAFIVLSGWITARLDLNVMLGPFILGAAMPFRASFRQSLRAPLAQMTTLILVPIFLALSGFSTDLHLLKPALIGGVVIIVLAGTLAKVLGALPGLVVGLDTPGTVKMIALTNAKGLMILVVAQQGKALGLVGPGLFIAFVVLAIVSNILISPLMSVGNAMETRAALPAASAAQQPAMD
jgi:Kef-type K+ transport system membrane component KefB